MGFGDSYSITDEKSMNGIIEFISSGKPVLFTHDTTSFNNDRYNTTTPRCRAAWHGDPAGHDGSF